MTKFPSTIKFHSDGTTVKLVSEIPPGKDKKETLGQYEYTKVDKRSTSKGRTFFMTLKDIDTLVGYKLITAK